MVATTTRWNRVLVAGVAVLFMGATGTPTLIDTVRNSDHEGLRGLLKQGANVNATSGDGTTALHWAAYRDDVRIAGLRADHQRRLTGQELEIRVAPRL